jgi:hypothetical protein
MDLITVDDLTPFATIEEAKAEAMIEDAVAMACMAAPCLATVDDLSLQQMGAAKAILRGAVLRWNDAGSGAVSAEAAGPYSHTLDTRQVRRSMFWPSEITDLQNICKGVTEKSGAFSIDTAAAEPMRVHQIIYGSSPDSGWYNTGAIGFDDDTYDGDWPFT